MKDGGYSVHRAIFSTKNSGCGPHALTKLFFEDDHTKAMENTQKERGNGPP